MCWNATGSVHFFMIWMRFTKTAHHWTLLLSRWIQSTSSRLISLTAILMLSSHLCLGLPNVLFPTPQLKVSLEPKLPWHSNLKRSTKGAQIFCKSPPHPPLNFRTSGHPPDTACYFVPVTAFGKSSPMSCQCEKQKRDDVWDVLGNKFCPSVSLLRHKTTRH